jgi:hypothetical protein
MPAPAAPDERLWPDPPAVPRREAPKAPPKPPPATAKGVGTGFGELFAIVGAAFGAVLLLAPWLQGDYDNGFWLIGGVGLGAAAAWRAWRLRRPGPRGGDWTAVALAAIGTVALVISIILGP